MPHTPRLSLSQHVWPALLLLLLSALWLPGVPAASPAHAGTRGPRRATQAGILGLRRAVHVAAPRPAARPRDLSNAPYPRLMNYNGYSTGSQATFFSRYDLSIAYDSLTFNNPQAVQSLRAANPSTLILAYDRAGQIDYTDLNRYGTNAIYAGWWMLTAGSRLGAPIDSTQTVIPVTDTTAFTLYDDVLVDSESMHVVGIDPVNSTLTVWRGFHSTAASHLSGARIATHAFLPNSNNSSNDDPINKPQDDRAWTFNMSSDCPRDPNGHTWVDFLANWIATNVVKSGLWDGIFYDNTKDRLYVPALHPGSPLPPDYVSQVDANNDGVVDGGIVNGVDVWAQGIDQLFAETRADFPSGVIMGSGPQFSHYDWVNGQVLYATPITTTTPNYPYGALLANYQYHTTHSVSPSAVMLNPFTASGPWNLQVMRYGLATSLLADGAYTYDRGPGLDGTPWWFDEYDNGAGTALTSAISPTDDPIPVAHSTIFQPGDTLTVENEVMRVTSTAPGLIYVTRGSNGTVAAAHDAGTVVATARQVQQGLGYLGQPLGATYAVNSGATNLLSNGSFDTGSLAPWTLAISPTLSASATLDSSTYVDGTASVKVAVNSINLWDQGAQLQQGGISLSANQSYALTYWAKSDSEHYVHAQVCSQQQYPVCFANSALGVNTTWTPYTVYFSTPVSVSDVQLAFSTADVTGTTWLDAVSIVPVPNPVLRRDFSNGTVLVNPSLQTQTVTLPSGYCHLRGDQNPQLNNGQPVSSLAIAPQDGVILQNCPALALSGTYSGSIAAAGGSDSYTFSPGASGATTIGMCATSFGNSYSLKLYDASGALLASSTTPSYCQWLNAPLTYGQTYTVQTSSINGSGVYRSAWSVNDTPVTWTVSGSIATAGGGSSFSFPTLAAAPLMISTCGPAGTIYTLALTSANGTTVASSSASFNCQSLTYTPAARDLFHMVETSVSGSGPYTGVITMQMSLTPPTPTDTPTPVPTDTPTNTPPTSTPTGTVPPTATPTSTGSPAAIVVGPGSVHPNQAVTVSGVHFLAGEPIKVFWDSVGATPVISATADASGSFMAGFTSPQAAYGAHSVIAVGQTDGQTASAAIHITAASFLLATSGSPGLHNAAAGAGFGAREIVNAYWDNSGLLLGSTRTNATGAFAWTTAITFTVPSSPMGTYRVYLLGQSSGAFAYSTFTVKPALLITPSSGARGSSATIAGSGYSAGETVTLRWNCYSSACTSLPILGTPLTDASGSFSGLNVTIPPLAAAMKHAIGGKGGTSGAFAMTVFTVTS